MRGLAAWLTAILASLLLLTAAAFASDRGELPLPVPRTTIYPGDTIERDALFDRAFVARTVTHGAIFESREALVGKVARRTLLPGQPIPLNAIREPYLVTQGKQALLVFKADGVTITTTAIALQNGVEGDFVSARNVDSGTVVKGMVQPDGSLRVNPQ